MHTYIYIYIHTHTHTHIYAHRYTTFVNDIKYSSHFLSLAQGQKYRTPSEI